MTMTRFTAEADWRALWSIWWETLEQVEGNGGDHWDRFALAVFLDVPALGLRDLVPEVFDCGFVQEFDLVGEVRRAARIGIERIESLSGELLDRRLPLETYTTELILLWEWKRGRRSGEKPMAYVNRIRKLCDEAPEFKLDDRAVADFIFRLAGREN